MNIPILSWLLKLSATFVRMILPGVNRMYKERQAGQTPATAGDDLLIKGLEKTLRRICDRGDIEDAWWRGVSHRFGYVAVTPEDIRKPAVQEWLALVEVQKCLLELARARIMGAKDGHEAMLATLREKYSEKTGEHEQFANGPIDTVVSLMVAGSRAGLSAPLEHLAGMVQTASAENNVGNIQILDRLDSLGPSHCVVEVLNDRARQDLELILKKRAFDPDAAGLQIQALVKQVQGGEYRHVEQDVRTRVLHWAARLHAFKPETISDAQKFCQQIRQLDPSADMRVIDALILETSGNIDGALRILRDADTPDVRATKFLILFRKRGAKAALEWFQGVPGHDDSTFLTGIGWSNVSLALTKEGKWEEAIAILAATERYRAAWPDLAFVEGAINAAMLLPVEYRGPALDRGPYPPPTITVEGVGADRYRERARDCFAQAERLMSELGNQDRIQCIRYWQLWLRLTDPLLETRETARMEVQEGLKVEDRVADLLPFAMEFNVPFDKGLVRRFLANRERFGGLDNRELLAEFMLTQDSLVPNELADILEQNEERYLRVIPKEMLTAIRIESLVKDKQTARAKHLLEDRKGELVEGAYERLCAMIAVYAGEDVRGQLEGLYQGKNTLIDLQNLIYHLANIGDWKALLPLLEELFRRERTVSNAMQLVHCLQRISDNDENEIIAFLDANSDLVERTPEMKAAKAWALLQIGRCQEAKVINDELLRGRDHPEDLLLDINLALQWGDRERFASIIEREWPHRDKHKADILMRLAYLAAEVDATESRAFELATLASSKDQENPDILLQAYNLFVQLGRENIADPTLISRAVERSSDAGPVWQVDLRTIIEEIMPTHRERAQNVEAALTRGETPLHIAAGMINVPLSRILLDVPRRNIDQPDGRRRVIVPIVSGVRRPVEMQADWAVGFDISSLMLLAHLGLLTTALSAFQQIVLAPDTMLFLINERRRVRFHQPSRVKKAEEIRLLIDQGRLKIAQSLPVPPKWLSEEVGHDLAQLLEIARAVDGRVVRPLSIPKINSWMEQEADLKDYAGLILSTVSMVQMLHAKSLIDSGARDRALVYLLVHDRTSISDPGANAALLDHPLFIDDLAIMHFQEAGLLDTICSCGVDAHVHPSIRSDQASLLMAKQEGERLSESLNEIRETLRSALESGKAVFLPRHDSGDDELESRGVSRGASTLFQFLRDARACDAICVDDRFINKNSNLVDRAGRSTPIVCILDLLHYFEDQGIISTEKKQEITHRLRSAGFALIPLQPEELKTCLRAARFEEGHLVESLQMRVIRQSLMRIRGLDMIRQSGETQYLEALLLQCVYVVRDLWQDESFPVDQAVALSDWIWKNVSPSPLDWLQIPKDPPMASSNAYGQYLSWLLKPMLTVKSERHKAFQSWVETAVLSPLFPANSDLIDVAVDLVRADMEKICEKFGDDENDSAR